MKLRKPFLLGCVIGFVSCVSLQTGTYAQETVSREVPVIQVRTVWQSLSPAQRNMVDLLAADFFADDLSSSQQQRILESQARKYQSASPQDRDAIRQARRNAWQSMSAQERAAAQVSSGGGYGMLSEAQRAPFRLYAIDKLGLRTVQKPSNFGRDSAV